MSVPKKIQTALATFLEKRVKASNGGWAPVGPTDTKELRRLFEMIIATKYEADADGDHPIAVEVQDRTRYRYFSGFPLQHPRHITEVGERDGIDAEMALWDRDIEAAASDVHEAAERLRKTIQFRKLRHDDYLKAKAEK